jgi:type I pantothenate kinase
MAEDSGMEGTVSAYRRFSRLEWGALRSGTPLDLTEAEIAAMCGLVSHLSVDEITSVFLPLSRLLNLQVAAARRLGAVQDAFLGQPMRPPPFIIAIAGSVAVGKSTFSRALQGVLQRWPDHPAVELVTTDSFLHPTHVLAARGLTRRKGFPESYDLRRMIAFLAAVKAGNDDVTAPVYSHRIYDIVPGQVQGVRRPDILIFEGLNVLQAAAGVAVMASDFFDFSIYVDADERDIAAWYVERFLLLQQAAVDDPESYFHRFRTLARTDVAAMAERVWREINLVNLRQNILPTRERARLVMRKGADHCVREVRLRRI